MESKSGWIGDPEIKEIQATKAESTTRLLKMHDYMPELLGYGISDDKISVICEKITPEIKNMFREGIRGQEVIFLEVGKIEALGTTDKHRPIVGGISVGHYNISAGTLGAIVYDKDTDEPLMLSNNHILAASDGLGSNPTAFEGDPIYQPGPYDGGTEADTVGHLHRWVPIKNGGNVDAAVATISVDASNEILSIPDITGVVSPRVGMSVQKSGRTTGLRKGVIQTLHADVLIGYRGYAALFTDQIVAVSYERLSAPGDSGSLMLTHPDGKVVGLLFAGSCVTTIFNDIHNVIDHLNIKFKSYDGQDVIVSDPVPDPEPDPVPDPPVVCVGNYCGTANIPIIVENVTNFAGIIVTVTFDPELATLVDFKPRDCNYYATLPEEYWDSGILFLYVLAMEPLSGIVNLGEFSIIPKTDQDKDCQLKVYVEQYIECIDPEQASSHGCPDSEPKFQNGSYITRNGSYRTICSDNPCDIMTCYPKCFGYDRYETVCKNGVCVKGHLLEANSIRCGYVPHPAPDPEPDDNSNITICIIVMATILYIATKG